jgi:FtsZ-interacting cell division protein ZipA
MIADNRVPSQQDPQAQSQPSEAQQSSSQTSSQTSQPPQNNAQQPVGTAAAGPVKATGIAASQPAGAAIAPAKQRRTRSIIIKVAALAGAAVAVGTVVALSAASPSRPR